MLRSFVIYGTNLAGILCRESYYYWHKGKEDHDAKRDKYLIKKGWKILHIKADYLLSTKKQIKQAIKQLNNTNIVNIFLDDWKF